MQFAPSGDVDVGTEYNCIAESRRVWLQQGFLASQWLGQGPQSMATLSVRMVWNAVAFTKPE